MNNFAETLKTWRKARRFSQLGLAVEANISSRHISFLETGRANPSREMVMRLGETLDLPLNTRNQLLVSAGFAPRYKSRNWDAEEMSAVTRAVEYMLTKHNPYPAFAIDRDWNVLKLNETASRVFGMLGISEGTNMLDITLSDIMPSLIENWPEVAHHTANRLRLESAAMGGNKRFDDIVRELQGVRLDRPPSGSPLIPVIFRFGEHKLALVSTLAQFGTAEDLTLENMKIELFFPADAASHDLLASLASQQD